MRVYDYHVVIKGKHLIPIGTMVRVLDQDGNIRGEGEVLKPRMCNFLNYSEIWI